MSKSIATAMAALRALVKSTWTDVVAITDAGINTVVGRLVDSEGVALAAQLPIAVLDWQEVPVNMNTLKTLEWSGTVNVWLIMSGATEAPVTEVMNELQELAEAVFAAGRSQWQIVSISPGVELAGNRWAGALTLRMVA